MTLSDEDAFNAPLNLFTGCHVQIRKRMELMRQLPALASSIDEKDHAAHIAADIVSFFERVVAPHHAEEERELWPMLEKCAPGTEAHETVHAIVHRLKLEHTQLEALWKHVEPSLHRLARGKTATLDVQALTKLSGMYDDHAAFEDAVVVPMARYLLDPADQYRLAMSLALSRHPINAYV